MNYISSANQQSLRARYQRTVLVVAALGASILLYLLIASFVPARINPAMIGGSRNLYFATLIIGLAVVILRRVLLLPSRLKAAGQRGVEPLLNVLSLASIICAALGELIGILGLVGYFLTGDSEFAWRLGAVGLLVLAFSFPRRGEWNRAVASATSEQQSTEKRDDLTSISLQD